jgi:two-component system cell cycle sensor histidine kinase/response regulator CckA
MQSAEPVTLDVNEAVRRIEPLLRRLLGRRISLRLVTAPHVRRVRVRPGEIEQVLVNLVANARDAMPNGGRLVVETADVLITHHAEPAALPVPAGWYVRLTVRDTGEGMDDVTRSRVFDPFFTTKAAGSGTGLGLSTVHRIVTESGGYVDVESTPGEGSAFTILLPAVDDAVRRAA